LFHSKTALLTSLLCQFVFEVSLKRKLWSSEIASALAVTSLTRMGTPTAQP